MNVKILILLIFISCGYTSKLNHTNTIEEDYFITKIDSVDNYYLIYAKKSNENFKFISEKTHTEYAKIIEVGNKYSLKKESIFEFKIIKNDSIITISNHVNIDCMILGDTKICKEYENKIYDVYISKNLKGLCYSED